MGNIIYYFLMEFVGSLLIASFFGMIYQNLVSKRPTRTVLTIVASITFLACLIINHIVLENLNPVISIILFPLGVYALYVCLVDTNKAVMSTIDIKLPKVATYGLLLFIAFIIYRYLSLLVK